MDVPQHGHVSRGRFYVWSRASLICSSWRSADRCKKLSVAPETNCGVCLYTHPLTWHSHLSWESWVHPITSKLLF